MGTKRTRATKRLYYFLRSGLYDIIGVLATIAVGVVSYIMSEDPFTVLVVTVIAFLIVLAVLMYLRTREDRHSFYYSPLNKSREKDNWVGKGTWEYSKSNGAYLITDSYDGFIFNKCLSWGDYVVSFEFKVLNENCGWIVRARDLSNYVMLQCGLDQINPHIKRNGDFVVFKGKDRGVNLTFDTQLRLDLWYKAIIHCEKSRLRIQISDQKQQQILDRVWTIPEGRFLLCKREIGEKKKEDNPNTILVDLDFGTIGFRCSSHEKSLIRDVLIEKI